MRFSMLFASSLVIALSIFSSYGQSKPLPSDTNYLGNTISPLAYQVLWEKGTELAFSSNLLDNTEQGTYCCAWCGHALFSSETKFKSGTGWPSFYQPINSESIIKRLDQSYGMNRNEVVCGSCGGHLGHVFDDGPQPTGLRYCLNGVSLHFKPD